MATKLIFIHGRNQQGKDPGELRRHWLDSLRSGFEGVGLEMPISEDDVLFPFFGDALYELTSDADEESPEDADAVLGDEQAADGAASGTHEETAQFGREVLNELLDGAGVLAEAIDAELDRKVGDEHETPAAPTSKGGGMLTWEWVQTGLTILDRFVPGASGASVAYATSDVAQYLKEESIRTEIDSVVADAFAQCDPDDTLVVVAHSLGSVIAYHLLAHDTRVKNRNVAAFITVGSPLGVKAIRRAVSPIGSPESVQQWLNAYDDRDVVALYPLDERNFGVTPPILNHGAVENDSNNHHKIEGYLADPTIALTIHRELTTGRLPAALDRRRRHSGDPTTIEDLQTPALVVDLEVFDANCAAMDAVRPGQRLRPQVDAFQSTALARRLSEAGHLAFCAATPRGIEGLVASGLTEDLVLTNETLDTTRLGELADQALITLAIDSDDTLDAAILGGVRSVLIDVASGPSQTGCSPDAARRLADRSRRAGLDVRGVMGGGYGVAATDEQAELLRAQLLAVADDVGGEILAGRGTSAFGSSRWCTELQAGIYCLMDTDHDDIDLPFSIALELLATIVSIRSDGSIVVDAGARSLGTGLGKPRWSHGTVVSSSDELTTLLAAEPSAWSVGDLVRLQPSRSSLTVACHRDLWVVSDDRISDRWPVDLRR